MKWVDYVIISTIIFSILIGLFRGFIREALSLVTWVCAFFIAHHYYRYLAIYFTGFETLIVRNVIAIALLFIVTLLIGGVIVNYVINSLIHLTHFFFINQILGGCFGALRGVVMISSALLFFDIFTDFSNSPDWEKSLLIPKFSSINIILLKYIKNIFSLILKL